MGEGVEVGFGRRQAERPREVGDLDERLALGDLAARRDDAIVQALQRAGGTGQRALAGVQPAGEIVQNKIGNWTVLSRRQGFDRPRHRFIDLGAGDGGLVAGRQVLLDLAQEGHAEVLEPDHRQFLVRGERLVLVPQVDAGEARVGVVVDGRSNLFAFFLGALLTQHDRDCLIRLLTTWPFFTDWPRLAPAVKLPGLEFL